MSPEGKNDNMNNNPETEFDLEKMFLPEWATKPSTAAQYNDYAVEEDRKHGRKSEFKRRKERGQERQQPFAGKKDRPQRPEQRRERHRRRDRRERLPLPKIKVNITLDDDTVNAIVRQVKRIGRAFPLFELARKALDYPDRQQVNFETIKKQDGSPFQPLYLCLLDNTLWLSEIDAIDYVLDKHFSTFYQAERTQIEPPKGKYTFVAQCGLSGVILGPPNHHDYQLKLRKLHAERFSRIPFDEYKMKIKIVRDEEVIKKWIDEQSWRTEYVTLNVPEPIRLLSRDEVIQHFKQTHLSNIIHQVDSYTMPGMASRNIQCLPLQRLVRKHWEEQRRFPMKLAVFLSQKFAEHGLQFFKWDRKITYVAISRPRYLDLDESPVSENVKKIIEFIKNKPGCNRHEVIEAISPSPKKVEPVSSTELPSEVKPVDSNISAATQPEQSAQALEQTPPSEQAPSLEPTASEEFTPEQLAVIADIHWLIHQGHIIEFYDGRMYVAKKPVPKPQKENKPADSAQGSSEGVQVDQQTVGSTDTSTPAATPKEGESSDKDVAEPVEIEQLQKDSFKEEEPLSEPANNSQNLALDEEEQDDTSVEESSSSPTAQTAEQSENESKKTDNQ